MNSFGYDWPDILDCEQFPFKNDTEASCEGGKTTGGDKIQSKIACARAEPQRVE